MTALRAVKARQRARALNARCFLRKPVDDVLLLAAINAALAGSISFR